MKLILDHDKPAFLASLRISFLSSVYLMALSVFILIHMLRVFLECTIRLRVGEEHKGALSELSQGIVHPIQY